MENTTRTQPSWFITGTSNGFGLALASLVLEQNHNIVSLSRHAEPNAQLAAIARKSTASFHHLQHDLAVDDEEVLKTMIEKFFAAHPDLHIDILVNNAALAAYGAVETIPTKTMQHLMTVNFYSPLWLIQSLLPQLRSPHLADNSLPKVIVNISSTQGLRCAPGELAYDASKHALEALSGVLAEEVKPFGVRTMVVNLGSFRTSFATSGERAGFASEDTNKESNPYLDEQHPVRQRINMVKRFAEIPNAARGDVGKGAAILFDAVMRSSDSEPEKALQFQRHDGSLERLLIGSDGYVVIEQQAQRLLNQIKSCEKVSKLADADDLQQ